MRQPSLGNLLRSARKLANLAVSPEVAEHFSRPLPGQVKLPPRAELARSGGRVVDAAETGLVTLKKSPVTKGIVASGKLGRLAGGASALSAVPGVAAQSAKNYDKIMSGLLSGRRPE